MLFCVVVLVPLRFPDHRSVLPPSSFLFLGLPFPPRQFVLLDSLATSVVFVSRVLIIARFLFLAGSFIFLRLFLLDILLSLPFLQLPLSLLLVLRLLPLLLLICLSSCRAPSPSSSSCACVSRWAQTWLRRLRPKQMLRLFAPPTMPVACSDGPRLDFSTVWLGRLA